MTLRFDIHPNAGALRYAILIEDEIVWPHPGFGDEASDFDPEDVLSYLVDSWPSLLIAQSFPIPFPANQMPRSLTGLLGAAEERWAQFGDAEAELVGEEQSRLDAFLYYHDLSQMKFGADLEEFYVLRSGQRMQIETFGRKYSDISFSDFIQAMECLGNEAAALLPKEHSLVEHWQKRDQADPVTILALLSGLPRNLVQSKPDLMAPLTSDLRQRQLKDIANDNGNPIYAAARGAGVLGIASLAEITRLVRQMSAGDGKAVHEKQRQIRNTLRDLRNPTDQGIRAAGLIQDWLKAPSNIQIDLQALSDQLQIAVHREAIPDQRLDGIAIMPGAHGPAIILNTQTRRQGAGGEDLERSLRFTWAHEIGHLLMDAPDEWPALVDVCDGQQRISRDVETRANAFAAYLLLPLKAAYDAWQGADCPKDWSGLEMVLDRLTQAFGLPRIVASRQIARALPKPERDWVTAIFQQNIPGYDGPA